MTAAVSLRPYSDDDLWLAEAMELDPRVMADLGGVTPRERVREKHARRAAGVRSGEHLYFAIVPRAGEAAVGTVGLWSSAVRGAEILEMGWTVLPDHQGRGYATAAGRALLDLARAQRLQGEVHAFPSTANAASNAICRKLGFTLDGQVELSYNGPAYRCNDWKLTL